MKTFILTVMFCHHFLDSTWKVLLLLLLCPFSEVKS